MGTDLYKQDLGSIPPCEPTVARRPRRAEIPGSELGTRSRGLSKPCQSLIGNTVGFAILRSVFLKLRAAWTAPTELPNVG